MNRNNFTVLRGGLLDSADTSEKVFESAYVTNTRLMGVVCMYIHFRLPDNPTLRDLHQFFYLDAEEYGFETYKSILGNDMDAVRDAENTLASGLGGQKVEITLREAMYLLQRYVRFNQQSKIPLPEDVREYRFLLDQDVSMSRPEQYILMRKLCAEIHSHRELINYFLMRIIGRDFSAASFLACSGLKLDQFPEFSAGTLCKNNIEPGDAPDTYICKSLIESGSAYHIIVSEIRVSSNQISSFERISSFKVSPAEASMMLARSEFVTVFEMLDPPEAFSKDATRRTKSAMVNTHESGTLYMMFHPNNSHVDKWEYRLNDDVQGMYFVSMVGQLIAAAYRLDDIRALEQDLSQSPFARRLIPTSKFEFQEPVLYEFIHSGFDDFDDFVEAVQRGSE